MQVQLLIYARQSLRTWVDLLHNEHAPFAARISGLRDLVKMSGIEITQDSATVFDEVAETFRQLREMEASDRSAPCFKVVNGGKE